LTIKMPNDNFAPIRAGGFVRLHEETSANAT
jgi:hypothetical protein